MSRVLGPGLRDRIESVTAMRALEFTWSAYAVTNHLLAGEEAKELHRPDERRQRLLPGSFPGSAPQRSTHG